jgi:hypothetical protein
MLTRGLVVFLPYPSVDEDLSTLVIEPEKFLKPLDSHGIVYILSNKGAEFDEISKAFHHIVWYMPFERSQIHLLHHISKRLIISDSLMSPTYLHQRTGVVSSPLFKSSTLGEPA